MTYLKKRGTRWKKRCLFVRVSEKRNRSNKVIKNQRYLGLEILNRQQPFSCITDIVFIIVINEN